MLNGAEFAKLLNIEDNTKEIIRIIEASKWKEVPLDILEENKKLKQKLQLKGKVIDVLTEKLEEKDKLINSMKNFLLKTCMMVDFLEWKKDFDKIKEDKQ